MKVWVLEHQSYGSVDVYDSGSDVLQIPMVKSELEALVGEYDEERQEFIDDYEAGSTHLEIEERFSISLTKVKSA